MKIKVVKIDEVTYGIEVTADKEVFAVNAGSSLLGPAASMVRNVDTKISEAIQKARNAIA
jgi:hypothetical protein